MNLWTDRYIKICGTSRITHSPTPVVARTEIFSPALFRRSLLSPVCPQPIRLATAQSNAIIPKPLAEGF
ncbi:MAG: hypothetical protein KME20_11080 [Kaiparowitsia implicata GSE-PSE-MK54-09C]|nr:hypothetical protein [Kaiparowitsia implicata GSE-PSE-MK54-09C]